MVFPSFEKTQYLKLEPLRIIFVIKVTVGNSVHVYGVYKYICYFLSHLPLKLTLLISTDYHPCNGRTCPFYGVCQAPTKTTHICVCLPCETEESSPLCDNNDVTHKNTCEYNYHVCQTQEEPGIKHYGGCKRESLLD